MPIDVDPGFADMDTDDDIDDFDDDNSLSESERRARRADRMRDRQRSRQHEERMAKIRNQHDLRMQKLMDHDEVKQVKEETKAEKFLNREKTKQTKLNNKNKVKLVAKLALAAEVIKFMLDHHADEQDKLATKDQIELEKAAKKYGSSSGAKKTVAKVTKKMQDAGFAIDPNSVQQIMSHTQSLNKFSLNDLLNKITSWINSLKSSISYSNNKQAGHLRIGDWGAYW